MDIQSPAIMKYDFSLENINNETFTFGFGMENGTFVFVRIVRKIPIKLDLLIIFYWLGFCFICMDKEVTKKVKLVRLGVNLNN